MKKKTFLKINMLVVISSLFSIITPIILTSCSTINSNSANNNNNNSFGDENNNDSLGNGNSSNNSNQDNGFIDKNKNPELFLSKHLFDYETLKSKTPLEIHESTPLYKSSLKNLEFLLKKNNIDYVQNFHTEQKDEVYSWYQEIGMVGEVGENDFDKIKYTPRYYYKDKLLMQKYLENFNDYNINFDVISPTNDNKINDLILSNPFGYLPSNLNQFLYFLSIEEISRIFNIDNLKDIYANYDDKVGNIDIYFKKNNDGVSKLTLNSKSYSLKKDNDFLQYIFDRTFFVNSNFWRFDRKNIYDKNTFSLITDGIGGTLWIIDRIDNNTLETDTYEFLVGTNLHVLDFSRFFEKPQTANDAINKYWDGGFRDWGAKGSNINTEDIVKQITDNSLSGNRLVKVDIFERKKDANGAPIYMQMRTNNEKDVSKIDVDSQYLKNDYEYNIEWGSKKYIDLVWYTPNFNSSGIKTHNSYDDELIFGEKKYQGIGSVNDASADFAIAKIKFKKNQIDKLFPKLGKVLGTEKEKDWYIGLGKQEKIVANKTIYTAGYPKGDWNYSKSIGGRIRSKTRHVSFKDDTITYWTKFNAEINKERNKKFDLDKNYEINHQPYYKGNNDKRKFEHGMKLRSLVQNSILNTSADNYLIGGASGSMAIDSRFNLVGFLFNGFGTDSYSFYTNGIGLIDSLSTYDGWDGSIRNDVLKKMKDENLYTIKLNPKNNLKIN